MSTFGPQSLGTFGASNTKLCANGVPEMKSGGVTIDWSTVAAVVAGANEKQRITITGTPTGGTFTLSGVDPRTGDAFTTAAIAYNAAAAAVKAALEAVLDDVEITATGGALPGTAVDVVFGGGLAAFNVAQMTANSGSLTGGTSPTVTPSTVTGGVGQQIYIEPGIEVAVGDKFLRYGQVICKITDTGLYGPYDPDASDGRQTLTRGECFILNTSMREESSLAKGIRASDHPAALEGGNVWKARLIATEGTHSLAEGPTFTELEAAFPRLRYTAL